MEPDAAPPVPAGSFRRLAALFYDFLVLVALWFIATFAVLPLTGGEALTPASLGALEWLYRAWLVAVAFGYFGLCWVRGGQTLGLRAWRSRLQSADGGTVRWPAAALRFALGLALGLLAVAGAWLLAQPGFTAADAGALALLLPALANFAWIAIDREGRSLQDMAGRMRVVRIPR